MNLKLIREIDDRIRDNERRKNIYGGRAGVEAMADDNNDVLRQCRAVLAAQGQGEDDARN